MKEWGEWLNGFYEKVIADTRLSPAHISLYFALLHEAGYLLPLPFYLRRDRVMLKAKICSSVTLNRCLRELHAYGYIDYRPSFTPGETMVCLRMVNG
jgi:hypothetical protein